MRVIIGNVYMSTPNGGSVRITSSASDPVPTCTLDIIDNTSAINITEPQEILILDDQVIPNPAVNMLLNPSLNPYSTSWNVVGPPPNETVSQPGGGGITITFNNVAGPPNNNYPITQSTPIGSVVSGQSYMLSFYAQAVAPVNIQINVNVIWLKATGNPGVNNGVLNLIVNPSTTLTRYTLSGIAPGTDTVAAQIQMGVQITNATNSGSITYTQIQFEPQWLPALSYPTPWVGPSQTNCRQLPLGYWIRQYRKFAGFVTHTSQGNYHGNVRTIQVNAVGYAWLAGTIIGNDTFTSQTDAQIISTLLGKYLLSSGTAMCTITNVITGVTVSNTQLNWDDLRAGFDGLCGLSGFYWTIDPYWNFIYAPPGYLSMSIALICDNSSTPDLITTFPAYNFKPENDFSQPGSNILMLGNGANTAQVIDPSRVAQLGIITGYFLPSSTSWMRKVNDSTINSVTDCTQRGMAELLQYDNVRGIYHLTTNVEVLAGYGIRVTSNTDGLNQTTLLIQQVTASWIGTSELLTDVWEYSTDLGAVNRSVTNIISRIFRATNKNTAATAINTTTLAAFETIGVVDTAATGSTVSNYAQTILADTPVALYPLSEITGTIADDISGNAYQGTISNSPTLGVAGLLTNPADTSDTAITFAAASSQYISLPTAFIPTGSHAWSIEAWCRMASIPANGAYVIAGFGTFASLQQAVIYIHVTASPTANFAISTGATDVVGSSVSAATTYHVVATYDGTNLRLYVNGSLVGGPTAAAMNIGSSFASIGSNGSTPANFFTGTGQYAGFYTFALSSTQVSAHYTAGT